MKQEQSRVLIDIDNYLSNFTIKKQHDLFSSEDDKLSSVVEEQKVANIKIKKYINEFWTHRQRQASSLHEISYRACFKPQLPAFFINLFTKEEDVVFDPFSGRGTTVIEAGILNRNIISNDINPLSEILTYPRFFIPDYQKLKNRIYEISYDYDLESDIDLSMFYHPRTESEIVSLKNYLKERRESGKEDDLDKWIRMIATNRLTGHSAGFFSVYTLPPNQAVSQESQIRINKKRNQRPEYRDTKQLILRKTKSLLRNILKFQVDDLHRVGKNGLFLCNDARDLPEIREESVQLTVTSPPFLDVVHYSNDNWLRCWFNSLDDKEIANRITMAKTVEDWSDVMGKAFEELYRVTKNGGWVAFEVGEVRRGKIKLDEFVVPLGVKVGFECKAVLINLQEFTKTSNIWGVNNLELGTNTNRIVLFFKN